MTAHHLYKAVSFLHALTHRATSMPQKLIITAFDTLHLIASHLLVMTTRRNLACCTSDQSGPDTWCNSELPALILSQRLPRNDEIQWGQVIICECIYGCHVPPGNVLLSFHLSFICLKKIQFKHSTMYVDKSEGGLC